MSKRSRRQSAAARDAPKETRGVVWLGDWANSESLACAGYTTLSNSPEVSTAVDRIAALVGSQTIYLMVNGTHGDERITNNLSRILDITPNRYMNRSSFIRWIVRELYLGGDGNAIVYPVTEGGYLRELIPVPSAMTSLEPVGSWGYRVRINGAYYQPEDVLHFTLNPGEFYPWMGTGYRVAVSEVANNLRQASATEKGFMASKWKPSLIVKVDAFTEEFRKPEGRKKLLQEYTSTDDAGQPWIIPANQVSVDQVKPLTLADLALADFVKLDKQTVASILGVPPFVLGVGDFNRSAWNGFVDSVIMPLSQLIAQELTRKLLYSPGMFVRFNSRSLHNYSLSEIIAAGGAMVDRMAMRRNEWRDWLGMQYDPDMDDLLALENYIPVDRLGDQKKLNGGES